ncbi:MAG: hypothetical protein NC080_03420 [Paraprevotella sp.]|nr:hypothetical protein [Paraprevotella sp.]
MALSLPYTLEAIGIETERHLPLLLLLDQLIRLVAQKTPDIPTRQYSLLPVRRWQVVTAHLVRMTFVSTTWIWLLALWHQLWLIGFFILSGYVYLALWHAYKHFFAGCDGISSSWMRCRNGLLACEMKMRLRIPALRYKMRNGLVAALMLIAVSLIVREDAYTDFVVLYTLLFPSLPLFTSRLGYEQSYMGLLSTRMHSMAPLYRAKYMAAVFLLLPSATLLTIPIAMGLLPIWRLAAWTSGTALGIYPILLYTSPKCKTDSPSAQLLSLATMTLPVLIVNSCA